MAIVKICGITNSNDAATAIAAGADALGFNFWPGSPRCVSPAQARAIIESASQHVLTVGIFVDTTEAETAGILQQSGVDIAQLYGSAQAPRGTRVWRCFSAAVPDLAARIAAEPETEAFLIDTPAGAALGGTGRTFDWRVAEGLPGRIVLAGGLTPDNVAEAIRIARPWGVDACSRLESAPGLKDPVKVKEFIRAVRSVEEI